MKPDNGERGISSTIGVILMVAITVVIAAVVGTTVLGIGGASQETPQTQFDVKYEGDDDNIGAGYYDEIVLKHKAGDSLELSNIQIEVDTPGGTARLVSLPVPNERKEDALNIPSTADLDNLYTTGKDGLFQSGAVWTGMMNGQSDRERTWEPGERLIIPLDTSVAFPGPVDKPQQGDTIKVTIVDTNSDSLIGTEEVTPVG